LKWCRGVYSILKKYLKSVIPRKFLFKNELVFRYFFGLFYLGKNHECNVCHNKLRVYINLDSNDSMCPFCGSLSRNRRLWELLNKNGKLKSEHSSTFHRQEAFIGYLRKERNIDYYSTDFDKCFFSRL
jgi:hypothetical protein